MKKIIKIGIFTILIVGLVFGFLVLITVFPEIVLKNKLEHKNYIVYSTERIDEEIENIIDSVENLVLKCEIYQPEIEHRIFFYNENRFHKWIHSTLIQAPTFTPMYNLGNSKIQNIVTFRPIDIENNRLIQDDNQKPFLTQTIAHEIIHTFQYKVHGDIRNMPFWKIEGYADYWSDLNRNQTTLETIHSKIELLKQQDLSWIKDKNADFIPFNLEQINKSYFQDSTDTWHAGVYYVAHLMAQYSFEIKKLDYKKYMTEDTKQNDILHEMFEWSVTYIKQ